MARRILERFPEKKQLIDRLMTQDPEFLDLCEDYDVCVNALRYWSNSKAPEAEARVNEYRTLNEEFEKEIIEALAAAQLGTLD